MMRICERCHVPFTGTSGAKICYHCRSRKPRKYKITDVVRRVLESEYDSTVRGRAAEIGRKLGWPTWAVKRAACRLGLTRPWPKDRRAWTAEENTFLRKWQGIRSAGWIARQLGRSETSIQVRFKRLRLSRRVRDGYSVDDLADCFGVDHHVIDRWIDRGWLAARLQLTNGRRIYRIDEPAIMGFIRDHRDEFDLRKVDQVWFLDLVFDGPVLAGSRPRKISSRVKFPNPFLKERSNGTTEEDQQ